MYVLSSTPNNIHYLDRLDLSFLWPLVQALMMFCTRTCPEVEVTCDDVVLSLWFIQCLTRSATFDDISSWRRDFRRMSAELCGSNYASKTRHQKFFARQELILESFGVRDSWRQQLWCLPVLPALSDKRRAHQESKRETFWQQLSTQQRIFCLADANFFKDIRYPNNNLVHAREKNSKAHNFSLQRKINEESATPKKLKQKTLNFSHCFHEKTFVLCAFFSWNLYLVSFRCFSLMSTFNSRLLEMFSFPENWGEIQHVTIFLICSKIVPSKNPRFTM